jgi:hypothetical protein
MSEPRDAAVEALAEELDANLPRMAFVKYGQFYNDDPSFDVEAYYRRVADVILDALVADPARARAVVAFLLTEEELARALHGRLSVERGSINHDEAGLRGEPDAWMRTLARAVIAALRSPDPADA